MTAPRAGQRRQLQQLSSALASVVTLTVEPAVVTAVTGSTVTVEWRTTSLPNIAHETGLTLAVDDVVQLVIPPQGVPFIGWGPMTT